MTEVVNNDQIIMICANDQPDTNTITTTKAYIWVKSGSIGPVREHII